MRPQAWEVFGGESSEATGTRGDLWAGAVDGRMSLGPHPGLAFCTLVHPCLLLVAWLRGETACVTCRGMATVWCCLGSHPASISHQIHRGSPDRGNCTEQRESHEHGSQPCRLWQSPLKAASFRAVNLPSRGKGK